jgi:hypothetical protein
MNAITPLNLLDLFRTDFRCSAESDGLNLRLVKELQLDFRYQPARIAMALSLADAKLPPATPDVLGKPIRGETLFGQEEVEVAVWVGLIVEHSGKASLSRRALQDAVAAHWTRGIEMLWRRWSRWEGTPAAFLADLTRSAAPQKSVAS